MLRTLSTLYVIELKLDKSAEAAMEQIDLKDYPERFAALRSAGGEGGDQFQYGEEDDRGVEDNFAIG